MKNKGKTRLAVGLLGLLAVAPAHAQAAPEPYRQDIVLYKCAKHGIDAALAARIEKYYFTYGLKRVLIRAAYYGDSIREKNYCDLLKQGEAKFPDNG